MIFCSWSGERHLAIVVFCHRDKPWLSITLTVVGSLELTSRNLVLSIFRNFQCTSAWPWLAIFLAYCYAFPRSKPSGLVQGKAKQFFVHYKLIEVASFSQDFIWTCFSGEQCFQQSQAHPGLFDYHVPLQTVFSLISLMWCSFVPFCYNWSCELTVIVIQMFLKALVFFICCNSTAMIGCFRFLMHWQQPLKSVFFCLFVACKWGSWSKSQSFRV